MATITSAARFGCSGVFRAGHTQNVPCSPMGNGVYTTDPYAPDGFTTNQSVLGLTYVITPNVIFDVRASYVRFTYARLIPYLGMNLNQTFGLPSYLDTQLPILHGGPVQAGSNASTSIPGFSMAPYTVVSGPGSNNVVEDDYLLTPSLSWVKGKHTFKFGADWRDQQSAYWSSSGGGSFGFSINFTCANALSCGASGNGMASALLGLAASGSESAFNLTWASLRYQGYYAQDTWQATAKLTVTMGIRYEIPGVFTERFGHQGSFDPHEVNPALAAAGITLNGQPIMGALDFANTPQNPQAGNQREHFKLFAPRLGLAYRLDDKTVIRAGGGIYYIPINTYFNNMPYGEPINGLGTSFLSTLDGSVTPYYPLSNPFPNGFNLTPASYSHPVAQALLIGGGIGNMTPQWLSYPYQGQWNFTVQRQLPGGAALEAAYAGSVGKHLPFASLTQNALPQADLALGNALTGLVPNPFYGFVKTGTLSAPTVPLQQLLLPFPEYTGVSEADVRVAFSTYNALQMKFEKRFKQGGTLLASYSFSKLMADCGTLTTWLNAGLGNAPGVQNPYNIAAEKSLSGFDARSRLVISYALDLPFGPGQKFLSGGSGIQKKLVGGWAVSGISTFQDGFPLALTATGTAMGSGYGRRPNVVPGCNPKLSGPIQSRLYGYFNTACYTVPDAYTFGNESATDPVLRGPGINNFNFSLAKKTAITERLNLQFRVEVYNVFNRVEFNVPNESITTAANPTTGWITSQQNQPRYLQLSARFAF